jgi:hypothetical protein
MEGPHPYFDASAPANHYIFAAGAHVQVAKLGGNENTETDESKDTLKNP